MIPTMVFDATPSIVSRSFATKSRIRMRQQAVSIKARPGSTFGSKELGAVRTYRLTHQLLQFERKAQGLLLSGTSTIPPAL